MASPEHVALIRNREDWTKWRTENPTVIPDLRGANLSRADLSEANLSQADLSQANLSGADLTGARLMNAKLYGAKLSGAKLSRANLIQAHLSQANLREANLSRADLSGADLSGAMLGQARLRDATLVGANLSRADLPLTDLSGAKLSGADLTNALLLETNFGAANLQDAKGLAECGFRGPCTLDHRTIQQSGRLPLPFLRGCGLPDLLIDYLPSLLNEAIQFFSCFISYSHEDKPFAKLLFDTLQGSGIRCWLDEKQMLPGDDIYEQVDRGIRIWDKVMLCCSKHSLSSWWVDSENQQGIREGTYIDEGAGPEDLSVDSFGFGSLPSWRRVGERQGSGSALPICSGFPGMGWQARSIQVGGGEGRPGASS
jgi:hypothetical protein